MSYRSFYSTNEEILTAIQSLHCPDGFDADVTYGNGVFYKQSIQRPKYCFDIDPLFDYVIKADSRKLPLDSNSLSSVVFDPPFITYVQKAREHKSGNVIMSAQYGGYYRYEELKEHYESTIREIARILALNGKFIIKCQDIVHNHKLESTHKFVIEMAEKYNLRLLDFYVLAATHRMPAPQKGEQKHARIWHSYFIVFKKVKRAIPLSKPSDYEI